MWTCDFQCREDVSDSSSKSRKRHKRKKSDSSEGRSRSQHKSKKKKRSKRSSSSRSVSRQSFYITYGMEELCFGVDISFVVSLSLCILLCLSLFICVSSAYITNINIYIYIYTFVLSPRLPIRVSVCQFGVPFLVPRAWDEMGHSRIWPERGCKIIFPNGLNSTPGGGQGIEKKWSIHAFGPRGGAK